MALRSRHKMFDNFGWSCWWLPGTIDFEAKSSCRHAAAMLHHEADRSIARKAVKNIWRNRVPGPPRKLRPSSPSAYFGCQQLVPVGFFVFQPSMKFRIIHTYGLIVSQPTRGAFANSQTHTYGNFGRQFLSNRQGRQACRHASNSSISTKGSTRACEVVPSDNCLWLLDETQHFDTKRLIRERACRAGRHRHGHGRLPSRAVLGDSDYILKRA